MELEDKSSSYLFWLSEYLGRKLLVNIGPNAAILIRFFEIGESASKGLLEDIEYQPAPKDVAEFIKSGTWKALDAEWMQRFESLLHKIPAMQEEIDRLSAYIATNEEEIRLAMALGAEPTKADTIIVAYINDRIPALIEQRFHESARVFTETTVTSHGEDGKPLRIGFSDMAVKDGFLQLHNITIDLAANMDDILADIAALVCSGRDEAACRALGIEENFDDPQYMKVIGELYKDGCPGYGPCAGGKCQIDERYSMEAKVLRKAGTNGYSYSPRSDNARAAGLWLWDYVRKNDCSINAAVRAIRKQDFLNPLQYSASHDRVFERFYARTKECIEQGKVLSVR